MSLNTILATAPLTTTNYILKATGTTIGNSLIWDNGTNVGIGNTNTSYTLDVSGTGRFTSTLLVSGNTSIGTTNSSVRLNIQASANFETPTLGTATGTMGYLSANGLYGMYIGIGNSGNTWLQSQRNDATATAYNLLLNPSGGNVGIGTSSPNGALHIVAGVNTRYGIYDAPTSGYCFQEYKFNGTTYGYTGQGASLVTGGSNTDMGIVSINNLVFGAGSSPNERMRITSGGKLLVGKTTPSGSLGSTANVEAQGTFYSSGGQAGYFWEDRTNGAYWYGWYATGASTVYFYNGNSGTNIASINPTTGVYTPITPSDLRLKDNIINYNRGLSELLKLEVKEWEYNGKAKTNKGEKTIGFVADQIVNVIPEWVSEYDVKLEESDEEKTKVKRIITNDLQYLLVKAIQEMNTKLDEQNQTIQNLQEQINILAK